MIRLWIHIRFRVRIQFSFWASTRIRFSIRVTAIIRFSVRVGLGLGLG